MFSLKALLLAAIALGVGVQATSAGSGTDLIYSRVVAEFIEPGFQSLAQTAQDHASSWQVYCANPSDSSRAKLVKSFNMLADGWAAIGMIRSGPASIGFRHERFYLWPERKNAVQRALAAAQAKLGPSDLTPEHMRTESAAIQGLPALERLLFGDGDKLPELAGDEAGRYRCKLGAAIAGTAAQLAADMRDGWVERGSNPSETGKAALATDLVSAYAFIKDDKIEAVIGKTEDEAKPRAAEFWRSGRSMRNIRLNLEALNRLNAILFETQSGTASLPITTQTALGIVQSLKSEIGVLAVGRERRNAILLRDAMDAAQDSALVEIPAALGVTVGFNSLDGD